MAFKGRICYNKERIRIMKGGTQGIRGRAFVSCALCGKNVKTLIMYTSKHHGNTRKVVEAFARGLKAETVDLLKETPSGIGDYDQIGIASGIYAGKMDRQVRQILRRLPEGGGKKAFVVSTSGVGKEKYNAEAIRLLKEKGYRISGSYAFTGWNTFGPFKLVGGTGKGRPDKKDLQKAEHLGEELACEE